MNNQNFKVGDKLHGFEIKRIVDLKEILATYYELFHEESGARYVHIANDDKENTFSVAFKTVPSDSTGVAHILEHTALCGSKRFPVRDPFFFMIRRSLKTFMDAFTASDWTMYPFSTQNKKDYYNLMNVYLDAAFFPNLDELSFKQEGHRLEFDESEKLVYKGVVYNEMKGAMSSPSQVMYRSITNALYPETTYSNNSGGEPENIPELTYENFKKFHSRHYHPSNAFFYSYGNLSLEENLYQVNKIVLQHFSIIDPKTDVPSESRWKEPKTKTYYYPLDKNEDPKKKSQVCMAWVLAGLDDIFEILSLSLLDQVLLANAASPLRKGLIDSGLGSALSDGTGFEADLRDTLFACGLKEVDAGDAEKIEKLIFDIFENLVKNGIDPELAESALHQLELHRKEVTNTPYPYGLKLNLTISSIWFHGGDPVRILEIDNDLKLIRQKLSEGQFLENLIKKYFLENPHRVLLILKPDHEMSQKKESLARKELDEKLKKLTPDEKKKIQDDTLALKNLQEQEDDASCLPGLEISDIPESINIVKEDKIDDSNNIFYYDKPTRDIFYYSSLAKLDIPKELIPLVPFFCFSFVRSGTKDHDYAEMARLIDRYTGGIGIGASVRTKYSEKAETLPIITCNAKALSRNQTKMFELLEELLSRYNFADIARLKQLLMMYKTNFESSIVSSGHQFAITMASKGFTPTTSLGEIWEGIHQFHTLKQLTSDLSDSKLEALAEKLRLIASKIFRTNVLKTVVIGHEPALNKSDSFINSLNNSLKNDTLNKNNLPTFFPSEYSKEGWTTSTAVSFVARSFKTVRKDHPHSPVLSVISKILRLQFLHKEIREKGGAYGGFAVSNGEDGIFSMASYRDPHIVNTLNVFDRVTDYILTGSYSEEEIKGAILQVCSEIDKPHPPGPSAKHAFIRNYLGLSDEIRQRYKQRVLKVTKDQIIETAEQYFKDQDKNSSVAVISSEDKLKDANKKLGKDSLSLYLI